MAFDVAEESTETLLPLVGAGVPCPAGQVLESVLAVGVKDAFGVVGALRGDPRAELVAIDRVGLRDAGVTVAFDVVEESTETLLPPGGVGVPCPAGQVFESALAIGVKGAFGVVVALPYDPLPELVAIDRVGLRDAGVTVAFDVIQESAETLLPLVGAGVPCPAGQVLESALAIGVKGAFAVAVALHYRPTDRAGSHRACRTAGRGRHRGVRRSAEVG